MNQSPLHDPSLRRFEFLAILGLVPPVSEDDVKQAYLEKVKTAHPDHGGNPHEFQRVQQAFEQATQYARFKSNRMQWLSQWVEQYSQQQELIARVQSLGGDGEVEAVDWLTQSIGPDFATVLDSLTGLKLKGPAIDDNTLAQVLREPRILGGLKRLELVDTKVTSRGLGLLALVPSLERLNLSGTPLDRKDVEKLLVALPALQWLGLHNTGIDWWTRKKIGFAHRKVTFEG